MDNSHLKTLEEVTQQSKALWLQLYVSGVINDVNFSVASRCYDDFIQRITREYAMRSVEPPRRAELIPGNNYV